MKKWFSDISFKKAITIIGLILVLCGYVECHAANYKLIDSKQFSALTKKKIVMIDGVECAVKAETFKAKSVESAAGYDLMCAKIKGEIVCKTR